MKTGQAIRKTRQRRGMTQWQLARAVGETPGRILLIERGQRTCTQEELERIAKALGVDVKALDGN